MRVFKKKTQEEVDDEIDELQEEADTKKNRPARDNYPNELPPMPRPSNPTGQKEPVQIVEREITLSLINDKLNYLINLMEKAMSDSE